MKISSRFTDIYQNRTIQPDGLCGGWKAMNIGTGTATVDGFPLAPGEIVDMLNLGAAPIVYNSPIVVTIGSGAIVRLQQLQYT